MCLLLSGLKQNEMGMGPARLGSCAVSNKEVFEEADFYEKGGPIAKLSFWAVTKKKSETLPLLACYRSACTTLTMFRRRETILLAPQNSQIRQKPTSTWLRLLGHGRRAKSACLWCAETRATTSASTLASACSALRPHPIKPVALMAALRVLRSHAMDMVSLRPL